MTYRFAFLLAVLATPIQADVTGPGGKVIDCYCTDSTGGRVELGQSICLFVNGRAFMARCEMSLNVPMWRETGEGCVSAQGTPQRFVPLPDPVSVDPKI